MIQKKIFKVEDFKTHKAKATNGKENPLGVTTEITEIVKEFLTPAGDQTAFVTWCKLQTMSHKDLGLMVINFRKWQTEGKRSKTAKEWETVLEKMEEAYNKANMPVKPPFNERALVREMCFKYGMYLAKTYFGKDDKFKKLYASKCAIYVKGVSWLMDVLVEQIEEISEYLGGMRPLDKMTYRRPISVIELTRLEDEKQEEADLEGILAWLIVVMEPVMTYVVDDDDVDYIDHIKNIQIEWHSVWEPVIGGKEVKVGMKSDLMNRVNSFKQSLQPQMLQPQSQVQQQPVQQQQQQPVIQNQFAKGTVVGGSRQVSSNNTKKKKNNNN